MSQECTVEWSAKSMGARAQGLLIIEAAVGRAGLCTVKTEAPHHQKIAFDC